MKKLNVIKLKRHDMDLITCELLEINDDLKDFYKEIECEHIDIVCRSFGGVHFDIICDDEALLKADPGLPVSWWQHEGYTPDHEGLFGTLLLCHSDAEGNLTDVRYEDLLPVQSSFRHIETEKGEMVLLFHEI